MIAIIIKAVPNEILKNIPILKAALPQAVSPSDVLVISAVPNALPITAQISKNIVFFIYFFNQLISSNFLKLTKVNYLNIFTSPKTFTSLSLYIKAPLSVIPYTVFIPFFRTF